MKTVLGGLCALILSSAAWGQSFREQFTEANLLTEDGYFGLAIPIWQQLLAEKPDNANLNYKLGRCLMSLGRDRHQSLPYLLRAAKDVHKIYDPFTPDFKGAPVETYFYLGKAYHVNNNLDSADFFYQKFLTEASSKHFLKSEGQRGLEMVANARQLMQAPINAEVANIGKVINDSLADYSPIVSMDENTMYFTSRRLRADGSNQMNIEPASGHYYEDMYVSYKNLEGQWMEPELLSINVNDEHSSVVSMSTDGRTIYLYRTYKGNGNIYESRFDDNSGWQQPALVGSDVNSQAGEYFAMITADKQRLYFVSDRKGGLGGKDIWYCQLLPNGEWGKALNMGEPVNTPYDEDAPYLHPDQKTLYFASTGHNSMGGYDVFYSQKDRDGNWQTPVNIGYPVNTTDDDHCYISAPDGQRAYYSSNGASTEGSTDIYAIKYISDDEGPELDLSAFAVLKGWVLATGGKELPDGVLLTITDLASGALVGESRPVKRNGSFVFILPPGAAYQLRLTWNGDQLYEEQIAVLQGTRYQELEREIYLTPKADGTTELIALNEDVLGNVVKWQLDRTKLEKGIPLGSAVVYLDENDNPIDTAYVSKDGYFEFKRLTGDKAYRLKPMVDGTDAAELNIRLLDDGNEVRPMALVQVNNVFYEKGSEPNIVRREVSTYKVVDATGKPFALPSMVVKFINSAGEVVYVEVVRADGSFMYHQLGTLDFYLELQAETELSDQLKVAEMNSTGTIRTIELRRTDKTTLTNAPLDLPNTHRIWNELVSDYSQFQVLFYAPDGTLAFTETVKASGYFNYHALTEGSYSIEIQGPTTEGNWFLEAYQGTKRLSKLPLETTGLGRYALTDNLKAKNPANGYRLMNFENQPFADGVVIKFYDPSGNLLFTEIVSTDGSFAYHTLPSGKDCGIEVTGAKDFASVWIEEFRAGVTYRKLPLEAQGLGRFVSADFTEPAGESIYKLTSSGSLPANLVIQFIDESGKVAFTELVSPDGSFAYHKLPNGGDYILRLAETPEGNLNIEVVELRRGEEQRKLSLSQPDQLQHWIINLDYNQSPSAAEAAQIRIAANKIADKVRTNQPVKVALEGSASRVPTSRTGGNEALAAARLAAGKSLLIAELQKLGIEPNKISTWAERSSVNGPSYEPNSGRLKEVYVQFQYFKIEVN